MPSVATPTKDLTHLYVVQRGAFEADGIVRERGEVLNVSAWRNYKALVETRYLAAAGYDLLDTMVDCGCGRHWESQEAADAHDCPARKD
jgi:hypothetical protein